MVNTRTIRARRTAATVSAGLAVGTPLTSTLADAQGSGGSGRQKAMEHTSPDETRGPSPHSSVPTYDFADDDVQSTVLEGSSPGLDMESSPTPSQCSASAVNRGTSSDLQSVPESSLSKDPKTSKFTRASRLWDQVRTRQSLGQLNVNFDSFGLEDRRSPSPLRDASTLREDVQRQLEIIRKEPRSRLARERRELSVSLALAFPFLCEPTTPPGLLQLLAGYLTYAEFEAGEVIFEEGDYDNGLWYYILQGDAVEVRTEDCTPPKQMTRALTRGDAFGAYFPEPSRELVRGPSSSLMGKRASRSLKKAMVAASISARTLNRRADLPRRKHLPPYKQIMQGSAGCERDATLTASTALKCGCIDLRHYCRAVEMVEQLSVNSWTVRGLMQKPARTRTDEDIRQLSEQMGRYKFFRDMDPELRLEMCRVLELIVMPKDTVVYNEGDESVLYYILLDGNVGMWQRPAEEVPEVTEGTDMVKVIAAHNANRRRRRSSMAAAQTAGAVGGKAGAGAAANDAMQSDGAKIRQRRRSMLLRASGEGLEDEQEEEVGAAGDRTRVRRMSLYKSKLTQGKEHLGDLHTGAEFGEQALLIGSEALRSNSVITNTLSVFTTLSKQSYQKVIKRHQQMVMMRRAKFLAEIPAFSRFPKLALYKYAALMRETNFIRGDVVVEAGSKSSSISFVMEGQCGVMTRLQLDAGTTPPHRHTGATRTIPRKSVGPEVEVARLDCRHTFGDMSAMSSRPQAFRIVAKSEFLKVLSIDIEDAKEHLDPSVLRNITKFAQVKEALHAHLSASASNIRQKITEQVERDKVAGIVGEQVTTPGVLPEMPSMLQKITHQFKRCHFIESVSHEKIAQQHPGPAASEIAASLDQSQTLSPERFGQSDSSLMSPSRRHISVSPERQGFTQGTPKIPGWSPGPYRSPSMTQRDSAQAALLDQSPTRPLQHPHPLVGTSPPQGGGNRSLIDGLVAGDADRGGVRGVEILWGEGTPPLETRSPRRRVFPRDVKMDSDWHVKRPSNAEDRMLREICRMGCKGADRKSCAICSAPREFLMVQTQARNNTIETESASPLAHAAFFQTWTANNAGSGSAAHISHSQEPVENNGRARHVAALGCKQAQTLNLQAGAFVQLDPVAEEEAHALGEEFARPYTSQSHHTTVAQRTNFIEDQQRRPGTAQSDYAGLYHALARPISTTSSAHPSTANPQEENRVGGPAAPRTGTPASSPSHPTKAENLLRKTLAWSASKPPSKSENQRAEGQEDATPPPGQWDSLPYAPDSISDVSPPQKGSRPMECSDDVEIATGMRDPPRETSAEEPGLERELDFLSPGGSRSMVEAPSPDAAAGRVAGFKEGLGLGMEHGKMLRPDTACSRSSAQSLQNGTLLRPATAGSHASSRSSHDVSLMRLGGFHSPGSTLRPDSAISPESAGLKTSPGALPPRPDTSTSSLSNKKATDCRCSKAAELVEDAIAPGNGAHNTHHALLKALSGAGSRPSSAETTAGRAKNKSRSENKRKSLPNYMRTNRPVSSPPTAGGVHTVGCTAHIGPWAASPAAAPSVPAKSLKSMQRYQSHAQSRKGHVSMSMGEDQAKDILLNTPINTPSGIYLLDRMSQNFEDANWNVSSVRLEVPHFNSKKGFLLSRGWT